MSTQYAVQWPGGSAEFVMVTGETTTPLRVADFSIEERRNLEPMSWKASIYEPGGDYTPGGPLGPLLLCDPYDADYAVRRYIIATLRLTGKPDWVSPPLVHDNADWAVDSSGNVSLNISGPDRTAPLWESDQVMADVRSTRTSIRMCHEVLTEIFSHYLPGVSVAYNFSDYPIPQMTRWGTPADWVAEALKPIAGWSWWNGNTLTFEAGGIDMVAASPDYALASREKFKMYRFRRSSANVKNQATVQQTYEKKVGMTEAKTGVTPGYEIELTLDNELNDATLLVRLTGPATVTDIFWLDSSDTFLNESSQVRYVGETPVAKVRFAITLTTEAIPDLDNPPTIYWVAQVVGTAYNPDLGPFETSYTNTYADSADQALRGKKPWQRPFVLPTCPPGMGATAAQTIVRESLRLYTTASGSALLDTELRIGQVGALTFGLLGLADYQMLTEYTNFKGKTGELTMDLQYSRSAA